MDTNQLIDALRTYATATIYEAMGKTGDVAPTIHAMVPGTTMIGIAYTVRTPIGQSRAFAQAVDIARAGSVIVIDVEDSTLATGWGGSASIAASRRGVAGVLTNGAVRDIEQIRTIGLPVFAAGISVRGAYRNDPGEQQVPVSVGGAAILPGDIIVGDADGVVVVPQRFFATIVATARARHLRETDIDAKLTAGASYLDITGG